ncbi:MAG TPA: DMT family transporter [Candidatus Cloacimonadota bacterium]|nr:DMT family transporter [Candidatus Cloacimonadota bacterium]
MKNTLVYFKAVLSMLFWALTFVWIKIAFQEGYRPYEIVYLRLIFASILLFGVMLFSGKWEKLSPRDMGRLALVSFSEPFAYFVGEANGLQYVSSTLGSLIISLIPIVTAVGAWLFLKEKAGKLLIIGLLVSTGGVVVMSLGSSDLHATLKGVLFLLVAVFAGMSYGLLVKRLTHSYSALTIVAWQNVFGLMFFTPLFLYYDFGHFTMMPQSGLGLLTICAMSLFASVGAFLLYTGVIRDLGVIRSNVFTNLIPVFTAALAYLILGDSLTLRTIAGLVLTIGGLMLSQYHDLRSLHRRVWQK